MKKRTVLMAVIVGALALSGLFSADRVLFGKPENGQPGKQKMLPKVLVVTVEKVVISSGLELTGSVEPSRNARLASPAEGPVVEIRVREGDIVKHGDALLAIGRKKGADALIVSLQEELKKEEDNLRRVRQLVEFEALPGEQLDQARSVCENVRAQLVKAEETLRDYVISAPWNGVASRLLVKEGEFVAPRAPLLEMYDPASLVILAAVPEKHATKVTTELRVDVRLDAYPGEIMEGRIERIYPYLDPRLRTRTIEISLDKSIDLLPGMFARLKVRMQKIDDAVVVPVGALIERPKGRIVFVVEDGKAVARSVETGIEEDNVIQIVSGVQPGDKIIIAGHEKLKNGTAVSLAEDVKAAGKGGSQTSPINEKKQNAAEPSAAPSTKEMNKAKGDTQ